MVQTKCQVEPEFGYELLQMKSGEILIVATALKESFLTATGLSENLKRVAGTISGKELELLKTRHPFFNRESPIILGDHVTAEAGTIRCTFTS